VRIEACIFDLDGVIVDSAIFHFEAWQYLASNLGIEFTEKHNEQLKGVGRLDSLKFILELENIEKDEQELKILASSKNTHYLQLIESLGESDILPGVVDLIKDLKANNIKIGLGSASKNAQPILHKLGIFDQFDAIIDGTHTTESKPHPQVFLMGSKALGTSNVVVFEDARKGVAAANSAGFFSIGIGNQIELDNADFVLPNLAGFTFKNLINLLQPVDE